MTRPALCVAATLVLLGCDGGALVGGPGETTDDDAAIAIEDAGAALRPTDAGPPPQDAAFAGAVDAALPRDAGAPPGVDAATGAARACPEGTLFCDDFESIELDTSAWSFDVRNGAVAGTSAMRAFEGARALRLELPPADGARGYLSPRGLLPVSGNRIYGRFYLLVTPSVGMVHSALVEARGRIDGNRTTYGLHSNSARLNSRYTSPVIEEHGGLKKLGDRRLPSEWTCVELLYDGGANEIRYWFDGVEDEGMRVQPSTDPEWVAPTFDELVLGFLTYQAAEAHFEVWYDAVAFDTERIGCM